MFAKRSGYRILNLALKEAATDPHVNQRRPPHVRKIEKASPILC